MSLRILSVELLKIRRKMIWFLILLGPAGVIALQAVNFGLRYDYLVKIYADDLWGGLIDNVATLMVPTLFIGLAIIASMTAGIEHQTKAWKQTLALPVTKTQVFFGKFMLNSLLMFCSATLIVAGTAALGITLGFGIDMPIQDLAQMSYYSYLAVMPFIALQVWLSIAMNNQALPLTIGIMSVMLSMFAFRFDDWVPWKWASLQNASHIPLLCALWGAAFGFVVLAAGLLDFIRRDVK
jgi:lantibiotic transport system permease protein